METPKVSPFSARNNEYIPIIKSQPWALESQNFDPRFSILDSRKRGGEDRF